MLASSSAIGSPQFLSQVSRRHAGTIYSVLNLVGRRQTVVRLRANLAYGSEAPDYIYRTLRPPSGPERGGAAIAFDTSHS